MGDFNQNDQKKKNQHFFLKSRNNSHIPSKTQEPHTFQLLVKIWLSVLVLMNPWEDTALNFLKAPKCFNEIAT